jgi:hypothetical protein
MGKKSGVKQRKGPYGTSEGARFGSVLSVLLSAGCGRPAWTPLGFLVWVLPVAVTSTKCGAYLSLIGSRICWRVGGTRDIPVGALFPEGRERLESRTSGWARVLGIDAVGGPPHCDFADKCCARVTSVCSPDRPGVTLGGVVLDLCGEVGDELGSLCQIVAPDGMIMALLWDAGEPGQRTWIGRCQRCEAPVEDSGHVAGTAEVSSAGGCQQVAEWVFTGFGCEGEQMGSEGGPGGFGGESGEVLVGLVELGHGLGSDELFGCDL